MKAGNPAFDEGLLARVEDAGINASAPPEQRWVDGWLVRFSAGKAKRARCIQAVAAGRLAVEEKLALCLPIYASRGLHPYVRITPFSRPNGLDETLTALGMERVDDTRVMVTLSLSPPARVESPSIDGPSGGPETAVAVSTDDFTAWVGQQRGSTQDEIRAHAERITRSPVAHHALLLADPNGRPVAGGQLVIEAEIAGLYDVFTAEADRGRGHAAAVCRALLAEAGRAGARIAYLQVDAGNEAARRIYRRLGFVDAYAYHYRSPPMTGR